MYHLVFPAKYRRVIFDEQVDVVLKDVCLGMAERYQVKFLEIGTDKDHVHFLVQSVPTYRVTKLVALIKRITAREIFRRCPQVKKKLWGGEFCYVYVWADGVYSNVRMDDRLCLLVIIGSDETGRKELLALSDGYRESAASWEEVLTDLKQRGLKNAPKLAVGDGALGFWKALAENWPATLLGA